MPRIDLTTVIHAPIELVFDLSRSIELHEVSMANTNEKAIAGKTQGLIDLGETVTWRAKHLGITQTLTSKVTDVIRPVLFADEMQKGAFHSFRHEHHFAEGKDGTEMRDVFIYKSPLGMLGRLADVLFLKNYMRSFLLQRNKVLKEYAESDRWKEILDLND
jgi:ligand-binding SRPBCC domain-containing protein